jgi:hypothetical protein
MAIALKRPALAAITSKALVPMLPVEPRTAMRRVLGSLAAAVGGFVIVLSSLDSGVTRVVWQIRVPRFMGGKKRGGPGRSRFGNGRWCASQGKYALRRQIGRRYFP